jgi:hypothetical protein
VALLVTLLTLISSGGQPVSAPQHDLTSTAVGHSEAIPNIQDPAATQVEATGATVAQPSAEPHPASTSISEAPLTHPPESTSERVPDEQQQTATDTAGSTATSRSLPSKAQTPPACISWRDAGTHLGTHQCFCGTVVDTYQDSGSTAFFINFSLDRSAFYVVSFDWYREDMAGECIQVCGTVESYEGRPQIVIRSPDSQVFDCP